MREIKFRAWDGKEMIRPYSVRNGFAMVIKECSKDDKVLTDSDGKNYYSNWDIDVGTDYPLMQFTGLKDRNGVDIYEGDLLAIDRDNGNPVEVREVKYITGCAGFNIEGYLAFIGKVVGNIHENPELLEQK